MIASKLDFFPALPSQAGRPQAQSCGAIESGTATRLERPGHVYAYAASAPEHHHHLVCASCQRVEDVAEEVVRPMLRSVREKHGFQVDHAQLDLYGICARCALRER